MKQHEQPPAFVHLLLVLALVLVLSDAQPQQQQQQPLLRYTQPQYGAQYAQPQYAQPQVMSVPPMAQYQQQAMQSGGVGVVGMGQPQQQAMTLEQLLRQQQYPSLQPMPLAGSSVSVPATAAITASIPTYAPYAPPIMYTQQQQQQIFGQQQQPQRMPYTQPIMSSAAYDPSTMQQQQQQQYYQQQMMQQQQQQQQPGMMYGSSDDDDQFQGVAAPSPGGGAAPSTPAQQQAAAIQATRAGAMSLDQLLDMYPALATNARNGVPTLPGPAYNGDPAAAFTATATGAAAAAAAAAAPATAPIVSSRPPQPQTPAAPASEQQQQYEQQMRLQQQQQQVQAQVQQQAAQSASPAPQAIVADTTKCPSMSDNTQLYQDSGNSYSVLFQPTQQNQPITSFQGVQLQHSINGQQASIPMESPQPGQYQASLRLSPGDMFVYNFVFTAPGGLQCQGQHYATQVPTTDDAATDAPPMLTPQEAQPQQQQQLQQQRPQMGTLSASSSSSSSSTTTAPIAISMDRSLMPMPGSGASRVGRTCPIVSPTVRFTPTTNQPIMRNMPADMGLYGVNFASNSPSGVDWVDLHYSVNGEKPWQTNVRMNRNGNNGNFEYQGIALGNSDTVSYGFTYSSEGMDCNTDSRSISTAAIKARTT